MTNDISTFRGDSELLRVHITDSVGVGFDITTATAITFMVKRYKDDTVPLLTKTLAAGEIALTIPAQGRCTVKIDDGDTYHIPGVFYYDIELEIAGEVYTVVNALITIEKEVTP